MIKELNDLIDVLGHETVLNAIIKNIDGASQERIAKHIAKEYNVDLGDYDYKKDKLYKRLNEREKDLIDQELAILNKYECLKDHEYLTDSYYYDIQDEFASKYQYEFDDYKGYPNIVYTFSSLAWKVIHNSKYV